MLTGAVRTGYAVPLRPFFIYADGAALSLVHQSLTSAMPLEQRHRAPHSAR